MDSISWLELFQKGGLVAWPILACSVVGAAIIVDRALFFLRLQGGGRRVMGQLQEAVTGGADADRLAGIASQSTHPVGAVAHVYLQNLHRGKDLRMELVRKQGAAELERVEARLRMLATISHVAPLLGLLGTVVGMVMAFATIEGLEAAARPSDLAGGIWEALLTTVFGLVVAIPCMAAYHGFESQADTIARKMEAAVVDLDDWLNQASTDPETAALKRQGGPREDGEFPGIQ